ncbi:ABC transporter permease [Cohnella soli]|uniref:ABC transporter permease n=1 Tax=Cohnella soli TaxID=425005 RepID=A0ABW0HQ68_9BACL
MKILNSMKIEIILIIRRIWFWAAMIVPCLIFGLILNDKLNMFDPGGALISSAYIVQAGIFLFLMLGFELVRREKNSNCDEVITAMPGAKSAKLWGKLISITLGIIVFTVLSFIILFVFYSVYQVPAYFRGVSVKYIILYWSIPFFIAASFGAYLGSFLNFRGIYVFLGFVWIALGPLNIGIFESISLLTQVDLMKVSEWLNLGQTDPHALYDSSYGLPLEGLRWIQKGWWVVVAIFVMSTRYLQLSKLKKAVYYSLAIMFLASSAFGLTSKFDVVRATAHEINSVMKYDYTYYSNYRPAKNSEQTTAFKVDSYDIHLKLKSQISADVQMKLIPSQDGNKIIFTLYHDLKVKKIIDGEGRFIKFSQDQDRLELEFPNRYKANHTLVLNMVYEGLSSPYFFANSQAVMLPSYFAWYPVPSTYPAMKAKEIQIVRYPSFPRYDVQYTLTIDGFKSIYTNLQAAGDSVWKGSSSAGISIFAGPISSHSVGGASIYSPISLYKMTNTFKTFLSELRNITNQIQEDLGLSAHELPQKLFFATIPPESRQYPANIWIMKDHAIIGINQQYNDGELLVSETALVPAVISALTRDINTINQREEMNTMFVEAYSYWYSKRFPSTQKYDIDRTPLLKLDLNYYEYNNMSRQKKAVQQILQYTDENWEENDKMKSFFREWYSHLKQPEQLDWEYIFSLVGSKEAD